MIPNGMPWVSSTASMTILTQDGWGRHLWFYAEESGSPDNVAWLVQKFLKRFRPDQCWSLTYAATCSKPRVGEFGGGAVFVTADDDLLAERLRFHRGPAGRVQGERKSSNEERNRKHEQVLRDERRNIRARPGESGRNPGGGRRGMAV